MDFELEANVSFVNDSIYWKSTIWWYVEWQLRRNMAEKKVQDVGSLQFAALEIIAVEAIRQ